MIESFILLLTVGMEIDTLIVQQVAHSGGRKWETFMNHKRI